MARADVFRRNVKIFTDRTLSPQAQSAALAALAKREVASLIASGRASPSFQRFVDGREGAPEESVSPAPNGEIIYRFTNLGDVITFALSFLRTWASKGNHSAEISEGKYGPLADNFYVGVDGKFIMADEFSAQNVPVGAEIVVGNRNAYNRKYDVQLAGSKVLHFTAPSGIYDAAVMSINKTYGNSVVAKRTYSMDFPGQYSLHNDQVRKSGRYTGKVIRSAGDRVQSPAIIITSRR